MFGAGQRTGRAPKHSGMVRRIHACSVCVAPVCPPSAIRTDSLTKSYGGVTAVDDLELTVRSGEVFGFLGPNGAGKSTTIDLLVGFTAPTAGSGWVLGTDIRDDADELRRDVGILPDDYAVFPELTGREHLRSMRRLKGNDDDPDRVFDLVGINEADRDRVAGEYSKGMCQRLALGMALVCEPDLLVLDEPTSGLDPDGVATVRDIVRDKASDGTTVFFSSHHLAEVEAVCDRVGIMNQGRLVAVDTIDSLRERAPSDTRLRMRVAEEPPSHVVDRLSAQSGTVPVSVTDDEVVVACEESSAKAEAIQTLHRSVPVLDFDVESTSLEHVFDAYTDSDRETERQSSDEAARGRRT